MDYYIKDVGPITEKNPATSEIIKDKDGKPVPPLTLKSLWGNTLIHDVRVKASAKSLRSAFNISDAIDNPVKGYHKLADTDYDFLKEIVDEPRFQGPGDKEIKGYPSGAFVLAFPIIKSILDARTDVPEELKPAPEPPKA